MACSVMFMEEFFHALKLSLGKLGSGEGFTLIVQFLFRHSRLRGNDGTFRMFMGGFEIRLMVRVQRI